MKIVYQCENCKHCHDLRHWVFKCFDCDKEICEDCMYGWSTCKECAKKKTDKELEDRFNK